ncbi:MAG: hypothetical protein Q9166_002885 [cf. Caloplaca sp. 2 TL-2023]
MDPECQKLRLELKSWEKSFATVNGGRKAGREDIKHHPEIGKPAIRLPSPPAQSVDRLPAGKYKLYKKLRNQEADGPASNLLLVQEQTPKKRHALKAQSWSTQTPQKQPKHVHSPHDNAVVPNQDIDSAQESPIAHRKSIGPTPQRNGRVLGLFDLLTPSSSIRTPSKRQCLASLPPNIVGTPLRTKSNLDVDEQPTSVCSLGKRSRSPPSASKTTYLASFLTPSTRRIADVGHTPEAMSPVSVLRFDDTPAFLRRDSQKFLQSQQTRGEGNQDENNASSWSPVAVRVMRPKPAGRGLSALVKGLRDMEEAKLDDELGMLREMEGGGGDGCSVQVNDDPGVCVEDSQVPDMPLGPDGEGENESNDLYALEKEGKDRSGRPLRVWKKKGQKRTTRRVTIKPNSAKWKPEPEWKGGREADSEEEVIAIEETQFALPAEAAFAEDGVDSFQTDDNLVAEGTSNGGSTEYQTNAKEAKQLGRPKTTHKDTPMEKKRKVVNAAAHTNYRALKIRNKKSKAQGSGRFGRRR